MNPDTTSSKSPIPANNVAYVTLAILGSSFENILFFIKLPSINSQIIPAAMRAMASKKVIFPEDDEGRFAAGNQDVEVDIIGDVLNGFIFARVFISFKTYQENILNYD